MEDIFSLASLIFSGNSFIVPPILLLILCSKLENTVNIASSGFLKELLTQKHKNLYSHGGDCVVIVQFSVIPREGGESRNSVVISASIYFAEKKYSQYFFIATKEILNLPSILDSPPSQGMTIFVLLCEENVLPLCEEKNEFKQHQIHRLRF